jgi:lipopolysaccharide transport system ATP-binding protein
VTVSVRFENVSKVYRLGNTSLRRVVSDALSRLLRGKDSHGQPRQTIAALKDVTFEVEQGEAVGIIGPNGVGKSTTLKVIAGITEPTSGRIAVEGRVSALLELGAGFHPDLTGRENIYLNAAITGMNRKEIEERFDRIVMFSELERFLDTPVKRYSSGMYCRLGFSVAAHVNPDILLVDEVLAVGDLAFQAKCLARMAQMKRQGTTILLVSHALGRLSRLCDRAILLHQGQVVVEGPVDKVVATYQGNPQYASNLRDAPPSETGEQRAYYAETSPVTITDVTFVDGGGRRLESCEAGDRLVIRIGYFARERVKDPIFEVWFHTADGTPYAQHTTRWDDFHCDWIDGEGYIEMIIDPVCLVPGGYTLSVAITAQDGITRYDWFWRRYWFTVRASHYVEGFAFIPHEWRVSRCPVSANARSCD